VAEAERISEVCGFAKKELGFDYLVDITSVDNYGDDPRFTLVYHLYGYGHLRYLRLKADVSEERRSAYVIGVWRTADWHEREIYDMMGIRFRGHPDLRRILMLEGYPYYPLIKDFLLPANRVMCRKLPLTEPTPLMGGPFVTIAGGKDTISREAASSHPRDRYSRNERACYSVVRISKEAHGRAYGPGPVEPRKINAGGSGNRGKGGQRRTPPKHRRVYRRSPSAESWQEANDSYK